VGYERVRDRQLAKRRAAIISIASAGAAGDIDSAGLHPGNS